MKMAETQTGRIERRGVMLVISSPSGAGKSTLIRCVNRLVDATDGTIHLGDREITG